MPPILFYFIFSFPLNSIPSKSIKSCPPCAPRRLFIIFYPSVATPACFWLVVVWYLMFGGRPRPQRIFSIINFFCYSIFSKSINFSAPNTIDERSLNKGKINIYEQLHKIRSLFIGMNSY